MNQTQKIFNLFTLKFTDPEEEKEFLLYQDSFKKPFIIIIFLTIGIFFVIYTIIICTTRPLDIDDWSFLTFSLILLALTYLGWKKGWIKFLEILLLIFLQGLKIYILYWLSLEIIDFGYNYPDQRLIGMGICFSLGFTYQWIKNFFEIICLNWFFGVIIDLSFGIYITIYLY